MASGVMQDSTKTTKVTELQKFIKSFKENYVLYGFLLLPTIYFAIFKYIPMLGNIIAFRRYKAGGNYFGEEWSGLKYFEMFWNDSSFWDAFQNTITLSFLMLILTFPLPIIFSLLLNEVSNKNYKKFVQSITIVPKFLSVVVVVMMFNTMLSPSTGIVNAIITSFGFDPIFFFNEASWFRPVYIYSDVWQFLGWGSIIYMAVLAGADQEQYEAAMVDGANRWQQTWFITLPLMLPTISINLIISVGNILNLGFEKILLIYTPNTYETADVIQTYVYRMGLLNKNYSYGAAVGLFQAVISLSLLWITNRIINKYWDSGLW